MQKQKKNWSQYEDNALKTLRDVRKIQKWSQISKILEEQFEVKGKNGKRCRERYHNHLSSDVKKEVWTQQQESKLLKLHNQKGNKWAEIAKVLGRSDNAVKNHYHSKLRKGIRRINYRINSYLKNQHKHLRNNIISKIVQTAEKIYFTDNDDKKRLAKTCYDMKNKILQQAKDSESFSSQQIQNLKRLVTQINAFNRTFKKKSKKNEKQSSQLLQSVSNPIKNINLNFSAENQQQFYESSKQLEDQSDESMIEEVETFMCPKKRLILENKTQIRSIPLHQQTMKKYQLRNCRGREVFKKEENDKKQTRISVQVEKKVQESKFQCKTPEVFQQINLKNQSDFNNMMNVRLFPSFPLSFQYFNYPVYRPMMSTFTGIRQNGELDLYRKNSLRPFDIVMIPSGNLFWGINNISQSHEQKIMVNKASSNIILQQSFTPYKKE